MPCASHRRTGRSCSSTFDRSSRAATSPCRRHLPSSAPLCFASSPCPHPLVGFSSCPRIYTGFNDLNTSCHSIDLLQCSLEIVPVVARRVPGLKRPQLKKCNTSQNSFRLCQHRYTCRERMLFWDVQCPPHSQATWRPLHQSLCRVQPPRKLLSSRPKSGLPQLRPTSAPPSSGERARS